MDKLENIQKSLNEVEKKFEENTLAFEILKELKESNKRKDKIYGTIIAFLVLIICLMIGFYFWHESQYETVEDTETIQTITQEQQETDYSTMSGVIN